jgi:hypothetical protein
MIDAYVYGLTLNFDLGYSVLLFNNFHLVII